MRLLSALVLACTAACFAVPARAQSAPWPDGKPINLVLGFSAGSGVDVVGRMIQEPLSKILGTRILIDYKTGAAGNLASEYVARSKPDGYTLILGASSTHAINAALYKKLSFDVESDFTPIATLVDVSNVLTINPAVINVSTVKEFIDRVKANPGKFNFASTGNGSGTQLAFAEFNARAGLNMVHVPFKGGPEAMLSVIQGDTCCIMNLVQTALPNWRAGKVRLLGVTTLTRLTVINEIPTIAESGLPGYSSFVWLGVLGPKAMEPAIVQKINDAVAQVLQMPDIKEKLVSTGNAIRIESPSAFRDTIRADRKRWGDLVRSLNLSIE